MLFGSKPVIVNDRIFMATSFGRVYAFSLAGKEIWHKDLENGIYSSIACSEGKLFVGTEDQKIYALKEKDGDIEWEFRADSRMVSSSPVIWGKTLYVGCYSGTFFAIDIDKGKLNWKYKTGDSIFSTPLVKNGIVYFGSNDGYVYALQAEKGDVAWKFRTGDKVQTRPTVLDNLLIITSGTQIYALSSGTGDVQWSHRFDREVKTSASVSGNEIFIGLENGEVASVRNSLRNIYQ
jgi:outer membrane protein assembly factor BamB